LILEQRRTGPGDPRRDAHGLLGEVARRGVFALPPRLHEQPVEAEHPRIGFSRERLERQTRRVAVAGDLRRLRAEQQHQRLHAEQRLRLLRRPARRARIAGAHRDHPPRQRPVAAVAPPRADEMADRSRRPDHGAHRRADQPDDDDQRRHAAGRHHQ